MRQAYLFTSYHYAVSAKERGRPDSVELFEHLEDALKEAKFLLYNRDSVTVVSLSDMVFTGTVMYRSQLKRRLVKEKA